MQGCFPANEYMKGHIFEQQRTDDHEDMIDPASQLCHTTLAVVK